MIRLLFKQKMFSWFDSYDIYDENENIVFVVKGKLAWGHCLEIYNNHGQNVGTVKEEVLTFLPRFSIYMGDQFVGKIRKELSFFRPVFHLECNEWEVRGDLFEWDYEVTDSNGLIIMQASKQMFNWTDTYTIDIAQPENVLISLMIVLAIDAAKCSSK